MTLFDRYLSRLWFANFLVVCAFSAGLIILQDTYNYFLDMVGAQLNLLQIAEFFLLSTIVNFPTITPFAFFVSIIFTLTALQKTEQITILKSCGLSLFRISLSFWLMAILLSALTLFISSTLIPKVSDARNAYIELCTQSLVEPEQERKKSTLTFQNAKSNRLWYIEHFDEYALKGGHSILHQLNEAGVEISRVVAQSSIYDQDLETWTFSNGTEIIFDSITGDPLQSINFESKQFIELEEDPKDYLLFYKANKDLSPNEIKKLLSLIEEGTPQRQSYLTNYYSFYATPLLPLVFVGITFPFLTRGIRNNSLLDAMYPVGLFVLFFILKGVCSTLGQNLILPALTSALLPYALFLILVLKLFWKK
ncbi:MAG: hypothetical protein CML12_04130 [Puniceicoccaceae bacterium]|nr:hypothetical protein [Puniceicoccaceae bacterium]|tara:strand:+ start:100 stop:1194 length:1095 start_codon:yes stop_codon:yes gene_type:complete